VPAIFTHLTKSPFAAVPSPFAVPSVRCAALRGLSSWKRCDVSIWTMKELNTHLRILPLTPDLWPAFEDLFGKQGPCSRCWCMYWRIGPRYRRNAAETNKATFHAIVRDGPPPGLLALLGNEAVGWCQLTSRDALPWIDRVGKLRRVDDVPVWSISCFYIRKGWRRRGLTAALIGAATDAARDAGASVLEAYPLDADLTRSTSFTGYLSTFVKARFKIVARHVASQPIVRLDLLRARGGIPARSKSSPD
jgi:GNAT superfamily N-acetyltransferase